MDVGRFELGITASRAAWINCWLTEKVAEGRMQLGELREGLGRTGFAAGPIEHIKPFLGPLYASASAGLQFARPKLPIVILLIMNIWQLRSWTSTWCRASLERGTSGRSFAWMRKLRATR